MVLKHFQNKLHIIFFQLYWSMIKKLKSTVYNRMFDKCMHCEMITIVITIITDISIIWNSYVLKFICGENTWDWIQVFKRAFVSLEPLPLMHSCIQLLHLFTYLGKCHLLSKALPICLPCSIWLFFHSPYHLLTYHEPNI